MITAFDIAQRFIGLKEVPGQLDNPQIMAMLKLDDSWPEHDETPWCGAFCEYIAWLLRLPRTKTKLARQWLGVGAVIGTMTPGMDAKAAWDVVILKRAKLNQPGPDNLTAPGHVGFYAGFANGKIYILGGNQNNAVNISAYDPKRILGIRRLKQWR
jgi:uncharacterized protein (TIGR02594 family)